MARKETKGINPYLPHDIIPNILCRLPPKYASQCRLVCKTWKDLILSQNFVDLNSRHSFPMILVALEDPRLYKYGGWDHFLIDKWCEPAQSNLMIHRFPSVPEIFHSRYRALFSHTGLVALEEFHPQGDVVIINPINLEKVTISPSRELNFSEIYGVFFHPLLREYCSLWVIEPSRSKSDQPKPLQYKMLSLGSSPSMKTIYNPFTHRVKKWDSHPLSIDKYLYWMLEPEEGEEQDNKYHGRNDIMQFDIIGEQFTVKPCPAPVDTNCESSQTHLLNIDGTLSFLVIFTSKITIWRLENHAEQLWTATNYTTMSTEHLHDRPKPIAVVDEKLALLSGKRFFVCNLMQGTMKLFQKYRDGVLYLPHQMSLASLRNCCQSTIYIDEEGNVGVNENSLTRRAAQR